MALGAYFLTTAAYSLKLKRMLMLDVLTLAFLYGWRLLVGGAATGVALSPWLMALSLFLFLSLAFVKRYAELASISERGEVKEAHGRAYTIIDLDLIRTLGPTSGHMAVLVLAIPPPASLAFWAVAGPDPRYGWSAAWMLMAFAVVMAMSPIVNRWGLTIYVPGGERPFHCFNGPLPCSGWPPLDPDVRSRKPGALSAGFVIDRSAN